MATPFSIEPERVKPLNEMPIRDGRFVLYWMQQSQRAASNPALEYAALRANELNQPLLVVFGLMDDYPEANARHYRFMLEGLADAQSTLEKRGVKMVVQKGAPAEVARRTAEPASLVVCDRGYLRHQKEWRRTLAASIPCPLIQVEGDVVVPVEVASTKAEYAARTIRPKIHKHAERFLKPLGQVRLKQDSLGLRAEGLDLSNLDRLLQSLKLDRSVPPVEMYRGGTTRAREILRKFLAVHLAKYKENRNQPQTDDVSHMSKYLHFGQISPVELALAVRDAAAGEPEIETYLEELLVRRELACNFVEYTPDYDRYECLPNWARKTLAAHARDGRDPVYSRDQLEQSKTADAYWNAAMDEMRHTGFMHNYMRMYWGKKILEWSASPQEAYETTLWLNNRYFIDGRDANGYANVGWVFGLHDRPWGERPIFGMIRYMSADGLRRKCDIDAYVTKVEGLKLAETPGNSTTSFSLPTSHKRATRKPNRPTE